MRGLATILALAAPRAAFAATGEDFKSHVIYQVLTDRFNFEGASSDCSNLGDYCGGTFSGLVSKLDYLTDLGVDAVWISPVVTNSPGGYHGYWQTDLFSINDHFGTPDELHNLVSECHSRGILVILDVVGNHMGGTIDDIGGYTPFNEPEHYHDCSSCPSSCSIEDYNDYNQVRLCRLAGLPDLNQTNTFVEEQLLNWISDLVGNYSIDGIRIDTVPEVNTGFWTDFNKYAGVYTVGEVFNGDPSYVSGFQGPLDATLDYPLYYAMRDVFGGQQSMYQLQSMLQECEQSFSDVSVLGTFLDNHDNPRFLSTQQDYTLYKNGLLFTVLTQGIPIIYYGTEQGFSGGNDPNNREPLWPTGFSTDGDLYTFIKNAIGVRKSQEVWTQDQTQRYVDDSFYAFTRGSTFVATTNVGSYGDDVTRTITYHPYTDGTTLCEALSISNDCVTVSNNEFQVTLSQGMPKVYVPATSSNN